MCKRNYTFIIIVLMFLFSHGTARGIENGIDLKQFEWSMVVEEMNPETKQYGDEFLINIKDGAVKLKQQSRYKFFFNSGITIYIYIFSYNREKGLDLLYSSPEKGNNGLIFAPPLDNWCDSGPAGTEETIYLIVSTQSIEKMDEIKNPYRQFSKAKDKKKKSQKDLSISGKMLYDALFKLNKNYKVPEAIITAPLSVSGSFKAKENEYLVRRVSYKSFFIKNFSLAF